MPTAPTATSPSCTPKSKRPGPPRTLALPVLGSSPAHGDRNAWIPGHSKIKHSRSGFRRAMVLILVHVIFLIHLAQWLLVGLTVSPVEPSESMYTLKDGIVNAGFIFFALAILSTLLLGRFFCGWGCHIVAVQDLCSWMMMRCGLKPRPFRSRLLLLAPVGVALYMFAWPVVAREVIRPIFADARGRLPTWLGQIEPIPGLRSGFLVQDFWATFASWYIAIPFILLSAVATVYFLGAKAFCTYGCPYGGVFGPVDLLSVGKIKVNDNCEHCGHCTAVCTSNVRVHEEVRDFGMVVDPGCMKCMDCISVCPNDALSFGLGTPSIFAKPREGAEETIKHAKAMRQARFDLTWPEEILAAILFVLLFLCYRGMFNQVPMLMAVAMAFLGCWAVWKSERLFRDASSRIHGFQLKLRGVIRPAGYLFLLTTALCMALAAWSGYIRLSRYRAQLAYQRLDTPIDVVLRPDFAPTPEDLRAARKSLDLFKQGSPPSEGGVGGGGVAFLWPLSPDDWLNIAYLNLLIGDEAASEHAMQRIIEVGHPKDSLVFQLAQAMNARSNLQSQRLLLLGTPEIEITRIRSADEARIEDMFAKALARHDDLFAVRDHIIRRKLDQSDRAARARSAREKRLNPEFGDIRMPPPDIDDPSIDTIPDFSAAAAMLEWSRTLDRHPRSIAAPLVAAAFFRDVKENDAALKLVDRALAQRGLLPDDYFQAAGLLASLNQRDRAVAVAEQGSAAGLRLPGSRVAAAQFFTQLSLPEQAQAQADRAAVLARARQDLSGRMGTLFSVGMVYIRLSQFEKGLGLIREATGSPAADAWDLAKIGVVLVSTGARIGKAGQDHTDQALFDQGILVIAEGVKTLEKARDAAPNAPSIRRDLAEAYYTAGRTDDAFEQMKIAANLAPSSFILASRFSEMLRENGKLGDADRWAEFAQDRARAAPPSNP